MSRHRYMAASALTVPAAGRSALVDQAFVAGDNQASNQAKLENSYDYIVVGAGASAASAPTGCFADRIFCCDEWR
jgi:choline dehydrogenase